MESVSASFEDAEGALTTPSVLSRVLPPALAVAPVSMLFGFIASQADWTILEVFLVSVLGFSGSGQFAVLPLSQSGSGFLTMLFVTASINSRYFPIAYVSSGRLPRRKVGRYLAAHMLGDEAYATESPSDGPQTIVLIRSVIFITWVLSALVGAALGQSLQLPWLGDNVNLGFSASAVLVFLSVSQLRLRVFVDDGFTVSRVGAVILCLAVALALIYSLGPVYFWVPGIIVTSILLARARL
ncbi:AzlC family ABC transporter permease [Marinobacter salarius]|uniref:AzlC family ABC transporter permease n=1 Tax=Marinobacter salarius TaxID=1420917 RepID=UPI00350F5687